MYKIRLIKKYSYLKFHFLVGLQFNLIESTTKEYMKKTSD